MMRTLTVYLYLREISRWPWIGCRTTARPLVAKAGEVRLDLEVQVPSQIFERLTLRAQVKVPAEKVAGPVITAEVASDIEAAISKRLGLAVRVTQPRRRKARSAKA